MYSDLINFIKAQFPERDFIPLHAPVFPGREKEYVIEAIDSTYVSSVGQFVDRFEEEIRKYTGASYAIATVNGTAALHMSLILAGVKKGDLILTQPLSFIATCNAISYLGAEPYFLDVDLATLSLSADALEKFFQNETIIAGNSCIHKVTGRKISACVPMHTFGHPGAVEEIARVCNQFKVTLIEDAAESIGSFYNNKHTGRFGKLGAFSFNGNKTITCGGGGVIITDDEYLGKLGKHLTTQAKVPHRWDFVHDHVGYNYRMPNLNAALACAQLEQIETFIATKRSLSAAYKEYFTATSFKFVAEGERCRSNYWLNSILCANRAERDRVLQETNDAGVMTRPVWELMHRLPMFSKCLRSSLTTSEYIADRLINLPSSVRL